MLLANTARRPRDGHGRPERFLAGTHDLRPTTASAPAGTVPVALGPMPANARAIAPDARPVGPGCERENWNYFKCQSSLYPPHGHGQMLPRAPEERGPANA